MHPHTRNRNRHVTAPPRRSFELTELRPLPTGTPLQADVVLSVRSLVSAFVHAFSHFGRILGQPKVAKVELHKNEAWPKLHGLDVEVDYGVRRPLPTPHGRDPMVQASFKMAVDTKSGVLTLRARFDNFAQRSDRRRSEALPTVRNITCQYAPHDVGQGSLPYCDVEKLMRSMMKTSGTVFKGTLSHNGEHVGPVDVTWDFAALPESYALDYDPMRFGRSNFAPAVEDEGLEGHHETRTFYDFHRPVRKNRPHERDRSRSRAR